MKKLNLFGCVCLMAFALSVLGVQVVCAQSKSIIKVAKKEAKKTAKALEKDGWELIGIGSIESAVYDALLKIKSGYKDYSYTVSEQGNLGMAQKNARLNALAAYAAETAGEIEDLFTNDVEGIPQAQIEQVKNGITAYMKVGINSQLHEAYTLSRKVGSTYEVQAHYLLNPDDAFEVKLRALQQAISIANLNKQVQAALEKKVKDEHEQEKAEVENGRAEEE